VGDGEAVGTVPSRPWSSANWGDWAWLGTGTGIWWLKEGFPASPATAGVAAMPPVATMAARISSKRFM
jgi:hypothetical protein